MVRDDKGMCVYGHLEGIVQFFQYLSFQGMRTTLTKGLYDCESTTCPACLSIETSEDDPYASEAPSTTINISDGMINLYPDQFASDSTFP